MKKTAAIIGGGVIGGGWLARFVLNGWNVRVFDPDPEAERKINDVLNQARHSLPMLYETSLPAEGSVTYCSHIGDTVVGVDWIQESVPERLDVKHAVIADIQVHAPHQAVLASSTSGFKPTELQQGSIFAQQIMVCHPFNPVYLLPLIEVVPSSETSAHHLKMAIRLLTSIGLSPLHVRKEIDAHIADRLLEAVWREGLWLINDDIATTKEIDDAIRFGFGLRWAQMGLFETYRIAGGEAGMAHFIAQFGPCLEWPWTKLMDVPELTNDLIQKISNQSDAQSGQHSIAELETIRNHNLVALLRALKRQGQAAGKLINAHEASLTVAPKLAVKLRSVNRTVPIDWTDYNGHMNEGRYGQVFSDAADRVLQALGASVGYVENGYSYFTVETNSKFLQETHAGEKILVDTEILLAAGKKLKLRHVMKRASDEEVLNICEQFLLHVSLETRRSCDPVGLVAQNIVTLGKELG
jgi:carnitine 3-dehydrogenase